MYSYVSDIARFCNLRIERQSVVVKKVSKTNKTL